MNNRLKYLIKNLGILAVSNFSSKILVFLLVPLYTSVLSTTEYGTYDLIISTVALLYPIATLNIVDAVMRFCMEKTIRQKDVAAVGLKYILLSIGIVGLGLMIFSLVNTFPSLNGLMVYIFLYFLFYVLNQYFIQLAKGLERITDMGIAGVVSTVVMISANVILLLVFKMGLRGFFIAQILGQAIPVCFLSIRLRFWNILRGSDICKPLEKQMLIYSIPLICTGLGWWINSSADKYVVAAMCGVSANGILSVAYKIPSIISTLQGIFTQAWSISAIKEYGEDSTADFYGKTFVYLNVMMSIASACLIILSRPIARILYANDFYEAWQYVPFLLISSVCNCASGFIGPILAAKKNSKTMAVSAIYGTVVNIILNIILVYFIGVQGATIATAVSSYIIYHYRMRAVKNELIVKEYWRILTTWSLLSLQAIIEVYTQFWYVEIVVIVVVIAVNRKVFRELAGGISKYTGKSS